MVTVRRRRGLVLVHADPLGAAPEQGHGPAGIAPLRVRQPDRDLGQSLPQVAFTGRAGLPRCLEDLVRVKRAPRAQQLVGQPGRVRPGEREVVGGERLAGVGGAVAVERPSQRVTRARVPRSAGGIAIPAHRSGSGSASQPRNSVPKISGRSSWGK